MYEFINSLLDTWRAKGKFGLTIPFLVGAARLKGLTDGAAIESLRSLLKELQTANVTFRLGYCDKADDLILAPVINLPAGCSKIFDNGLPTTLWVQSDLVNSGRVESSELVQMLWDRYGSDLDAERYSCTKGKYHSFTQEDFTLIEISFAKIA